MRFIKTALATNWPAKESSGKPLIEGLLTRVIPEANPDHPFHLVRVWLIEFDDDGVPSREIGLDASGEPVLAGPDDRNYGFWLDTNMRFYDFVGDDVSAEVFERLWLSMKSK